MVVLTFCALAIETTSTLHGFETEMLASEENLLGLMALNRELVGQAEAFDDAERVVLDLDSTESPVHGQQEGSAYNGHFESVCYHPLLLFNGHGDCLAAKLRPGNVHSAEDWDELLLPEIERQQAAGKQVAFRGDAAFAKNPAVVTPYTRNARLMMLRVCRMCCRAHQSTALYPTQHNCTCPKPAWQTLPPRSIRATPACRRQQPSY